MVIDGDLDAPGIGTFFAVEKLGLGDSEQSVGANLIPGEGESETDKRQPPAAGGGGARWGVVHDLLEGPSAGEADLSDYYQSVRNEPIVSWERGDSRFPAGCIDENYVAKLARLDFDPARKGSTTPWAELLQRIRHELSPNWILLDSRAGLGEPAVPRAAWRIFTFSWEHPLSRVGRGFASSWIASARRGCSGQAPGRVRAGAGNDS